MLVLSLCTTGAWSQTMVRSIDGSGNNLAAPSYGVAGAPLARCLPADYGDGISTMAGAARANPRTISNAVSSQPASVRNARQLSDFVWQWGQFIDHDVGLTRGGGAAANISVTGVGDPLAPVIPFSRSAVAGGTGVTSAAQQVNEVTSYIDGSMLYGSDAVRAGNLRTGSGGQLTLSAGSLLMYNTVGEENDNMNPGLAANQLFLSGDVRANENIGLTALHTVFAREHNRVAADLALANPAQSDQQIFDQARAVVVGEIQSITYNEFLPALLGTGAPSLSSASYDPTADATLSNGFATAAFRIGHTMVSPELQRIDNAGNNLGAVDLQNSFFVPTHFSGVGGAAEVDYIMKGMAGQVMQEVDLGVIDDLRNALFGAPGAGGMDLAALNIQRGRDHGLPDYNTARSLFGLTAASTWTQVTSDPLLQMNLASVYGATPGDLDLWVGMLAEDHLTGSSTGALLASMLNKEFTNLMEADRFFYLWDPLLDSTTRDEISGTTLSQILLRNTDIEFLQANVFVVPEPSRALLLLLGGICTILRRCRS